MLDLIQEDIQIPDGPWVTMHKLNEEDKESNGGGDGRCKDHNNIRYTCHECKSAGNGGGGGICDHNNIRYLCDECKLAGNGGGASC